MDSGRKPLVPLWNANSKGVLVSFWQPYCLPYEEDQENEEGRKETGRELGEVICEPEHTLDPPGYVDQ